MANLLRLRLSCPRRQLASNLSKKIMPDDLPILYVKTGCPWCGEAATFLANNGVGFREKNVSQDQNAASEMAAKSGQTKAPVLDWHGQILTDFGVVELKPFLQRLNVKLEDS